MVYTDEDKRFPPQSVTGDLSANTSPDYRFCTHSESRMAHDAWRDSHMKSLGKDMGDEMSGAVGGRRILIIDDEATIADTLALIFSSSGYEAKTAYSAEQALETLEDWRPNLAIIDVVLPGMNGIEFAIFLKASYPDCQFLLFSGQPGTSGLLEDAKKKGHLFEILAKPLHPTYMLATVAGMLTTCEDSKPPNLMH
jgi:CheY-like chemotaxis protein